MRCGSELALICHTFVTYRVAVRARLVLGLALLSLALATTAHTSTSATAELRLDGVPFRPELALTSAQHGIGLMYRKKAPKDGMLFVFSRASDGGFWMKNTLVPLKIVFFDTRGRAVRTMRMTPCREDPCTIYAPGKQYRYALELPATDTRPAQRLGPPAELRRVLQLAS